MREGDGEACRTEQLVVNWHVVAQQCRGGGDGRDNYAVGDYLSGRDRRRSGAGGPAVMEFRHDVRTIRVHSTRIAGGGGLAGDPLSPHYGRVGKVAGAVPHTRRPAELEWRNSPLGVWSQLPALGSREDGDGMNELAPIASSNAPALVATAGARASYRFLEFFTAQIRNPHTRRGGAARRTFAGRPRRRQHSVQ